MWTLRNVIEAIGFENKYLFPDIMKLVNKLTGENPKLMK